MSVEGAKNATSRWNAPSSESDIFHKWICIYSHPAAGRWDFRGRFFPLSAPIPALLRHLRRQPTDPRPRWKCKSNRGRTRGATLARATPRGEEYVNDTTRRRASDTISLPARQTRELGRGPKGKIYCAWITVESARERTRPRDQVKRPNVIELLGIRLRSHVSRRVKIARRFSRDCSV